MAPQQVVEQSHREFWILVFRTKRSAYCRHVNVVLVLLVSCDRLNLAKPAANANDLSTMVEDRPLLLHFARKEEHALSQDTVDGEPQIRCDASRDCWLL